MTTTPTSVDLGALGVRFLARAAETGGGFSVVEHPMAPRALAAPLHRHSREDEYSYVLEGRMGALLGEETVYAEAGDFVCKPRGQWHTFWNAGDEPCRILEIIAPGGFERYFAELAELLASPGFAPPQLIELGARYGVEYRPESIERLCAEHGLTLG
jgi:mannose-6-phosphate isomerase-like protein (cupin superfamily)